MVETRVCELCGVELNEYNRITPESTRCRLCSVGVHADGRIVRTFQWFERHPDIDDRAIGADSAWRSMWRVLATWAIIAACTLTTYLLARNNIIAGLIGTFGGVLLSMPLVFAVSGPLDRLRWQRAWSGIVIAYWIVFLVCVFVISGPLIRLAKAWQLDRRGLMLLILGASLVVGLIAGVLNVLRANASDKATVLTQYQLWRQSRGEKPRTRAQAQPLPQPPPRDERLPPPLP